MSGCIKIRGVEYSVADTVRFEWDTHQYPKMTAEDMAAIGKLKNLKELDCIADISTPDLSPLADLGELMSLSLWGRHNEIDLAPVGMLTKLEFLSLTELNIHDITPLKRLVDLKELQLPLNEVEKLSTLARMPRLAVLNLCGNRISDIRPLAKLSKLKRLDISADKIADLSPLEALANLERLRLDVNERTHKKRKWTKKEQDRLKLKLPNCRIDFCDFDII